MDQEKQREIWRKKWAKTSKERKHRKYLRDRERHKERMKTDPEYAERMRYLERKRKERQRKLRGEKINEQQRMRYNANAVEQRGKINHNRRKRDPTIGLASLIKDVRAGRRPAGDLVNAVRSAVEQSSTLVHGAPGKSLPGK